jgi:hypothetical protein
MIYLLIGMSILLTVLTFQNLRLTKELRQVQDDLHSLHIQVDLAVDVIGGNQDLLKDVVDLLSIRYRNMQIVR